ncbi:MAG: DNA polymerase III subunit delta [Phycisphaeraceae bacterium]|nr:DNA polymerase III subunit delta [Phycisphaeraceae bacterium]
MAKKATTAAARRPLDTDCRVVLLIGADAFIAGEHTQALKEKLITEHGEVDILSFDGQNANLADVLDECRSFGLMQQHKMVVVDNADQFVKEEKRSLVERYTQEPSEGATLVLRATKWHKGKLDEMIAAVGTIVQCDEVEEATAVNWAIKRAEKRHAAKLDLKAAQALVERVGCELGRIDCELGKLAVAGSKPGVISVELVSQFVGKSREEEVWGIQSTLVSGDSQQAVAHVRDLIQVSRQPTIMIFWAMTDLARKLHGAARGIRAGVNPFALAGALKLWGPSKEIILHAAGKVDPNSAADLLDACVKADVRQKTGLGEPERSAEILALKFAEVCGS